MGFGDALGGIVGGLIGGAISGGDSRTARESADKAYQELLNIGAPPETAKALVLQQFSSAGVLTPEMEQYIQQGPSQVEAITEDPALKERQMSALNLLAQRAESGGLNPEDRAKYAEIRDQLAREQNAKQQQIVQQYQMRGMGGSGAELAAALSNQQAGANQASQAGNQLAAAASQNALQAALQSGQLGGQIRQQNFDVNKARASAADEMNRFNVQNRTAQQSRNVGARNQAQQFNLTNNQQLANANVAMGNQETQRQNQAKVDDWNNQVKLAKLKSGAYNDQAEDFNKRAQQTRDQYGQIGGTIGQAAGLLAMNKGGMVPGIAKVSGDHPVNDTVAAHLSPGEIVLPKSIMESHDPGDVAKKFVNYIQALNKKPEYKYGKDK